MSLLYYPQRYKASILRLSLLKDFSYAKNHAFKQKSFAGIKYITTFALQCFLWGMVKWLIIRNEARLLD